MRPRDLTRLAAGSYDLLVIGGGIAGLTIAYEASSRGLRTALVDAADFGGATSFNLQKTAHGGLRSLQSGRLDRALESIHERRALARIAPWLLRPLPFLVGTYRSWTRSRLALRAAFTIDGMLGRRRNDGLEPELHLPVPRLLSKAAMLRLFPGINPDGLTGGAQWYDYQMVEAERLTFAFAEAADRRGADLANYVEAVAATREGPRVTGMEARDTLTGRTFTISARATVNATGARTATVMALFGDPRPVPMLKAMNLITTVPASDIALAAPSATGRMLTLVPWRGCALIGTSQSPLAAGASGTSVTSAEVAAFVGEANSAFPSLGLTPARVSLVHRGIVPAAGDGRTDLRSHGSLIEHAGRSAFSVLGLKYTTARRVAEQTVDAIARTLKVAARPSRTAVAMLPGASIADHEALAIETARALHLEVPPRTLTHLTTRYAERAADIVRLMKERPEWMEPLDRGCAATGAEVIHVIRQEMAVHLTDILMRRTALGAAGHPGRAVVEACAAIAGRELGWDAARIADEIRALDDVYRIDPS
ncbi:MAG: FAD-dependent oxidoreductase [Vicinamibacterales bacterium]